MEDKIMVRKKKFILWYGPLSICALGVDWFLFRTCVDMNLYGSGGPVSLRLLFYFSLFLFLPLIDFAVNGLIKLIQYLRMPVEFWYVEKRALSNLRAKTLWKDTKDRVWRITWLWTLAEAGLYTVLTAVLIHTMRDERRETAVYILMVIMIFFCGHSEKKAKDKEKMKLMEIFTEDCDPLLYADLLEIDLSEADSKQRLNNDYLSLAYAYFYAGDYDRMEDRLRRFDAGRGVTRVKLLVLKMRGCMLLDSGRVAEFNACAEELNRLIQGGRMLPEADRELAEKTRSLWNLMIAVKTQDPVKLSECVNDNLLDQQKSKLSRMEYLYYLGKAQMLLGLTEAGGSNLETVAREAGTMGIRRLASERT